MLGFTGLHSKEVNKLSWITANEINTKEFVLERSVNGTNFNEVATIKANGSGGGNYIYNDAGSFVNKTFYRLRIIDTDGKFTYSKIVIIIGDNQFISIYPNPVKNYTVLEVNNNLINTKAIITDVGGKLLTAITIQQNITKIDLSNYANGIYLLKTQNGEVIKMVKQ